MEIKIGKKKIGGKNPCFVIAEIGINHNNDLETAKKMIEVVAKSGCDVAKFQNFKIGHLYSKKSGKLDWRDKNKKYSYDIYKANKHYEMLAEWVPELMKHCKKNNVMFLSSVWDIPSTDFLDKLRMPAFKIGGSAMTNIPLVEHIAKKGKPIFMSVAGASLGEIEETTETILKHNRNLVIMHCHLKYPTPIEYTNMSVLETLKFAFPEALIGYSDHTEHPYAAPVAAIALGAKVIEKHITLDKKMKGPDHFFALEPKKLNLMVKKIREAEKKLKRKEKIKISKKILGSSEVKVYNIEKYLKEFAYQTIIAFTPIKKGQRLTEKNIRILRPGKLGRGLDPKFYKLLIDKKYKVIKDLPEGKPLTWDDLIEK